MPRPVKRRRVCCMPVSGGFEPMKKGNNDSVIIMTVDEYETVRLIDKQGFSQEECGEYMGIARTTAQQIYNDARRKIAEALVEGISLKIEGGNYVLCGDGEKGCGRKGCGCGAGRGTDCRRKTCEIGGCQGRLR